MSDCQIHTKHATFLLVVPSHAQCILAEWAVALSVALGRGALSARCILSILKEYIANELVHALRCRRVRNSHWEQNKVLFVVQQRGGALAHSNQVKYMQ